MIEFKLVNMEAGLVKYLLMEVFGVSFSSDFGRKEHCHCFFLNCNGLQKLNDVHRDIRWLNETWCLRQAWIWVSRYIKTIGDFGIYSDPRLRHRTKSKTFQTHKPPKLKVCQLIPRIEIQLCSMGWNVMFFKIWRNQ